MKLDDQFEWDLDNADACPERFAEVYAKELGLSGEFKCVTPFDFLYDAETVLTLLPLRPGRPSRIVSESKFKRTKSRSSLLVTPLMGPFKMKTFARPSYRVSPQVHVQWIKYNRSRRCSTTSATGNWRGMRRTAIRT
jgi:SNF5 / SMARCB1 / INI1